MDNLEQMGNKAYQKGMWGDYKEAVAILSDAIAEYPFDRRLYNDRSYYYHKLKNYRSALSDAEFILKLFPTYTRAHFRKGEVLMDLKKYDEAERVFRDLLKLVPDNEEVKFYLLDAQISQLTKDGTCWVRDAKRALEINDFNTERAKSFLELESENRLNYYDECDVYDSDEEVEETPLVRSVRPGACRKPNYCHGAGDGGYDPFMDPSNPFQTNALWVGNVTDRITEQSLESVFSTYGKIKSVIVQHNNSCAFINYALPSMASNAMSRFPKNLHVEDTTLVIRFPDSARTRNSTTNYCGSKAAKKK